MLRQLFRPARLQTQGFYNKSKNHNKPKAVVSPTPQQQETPKVTQVIAQNSEPVPQVHEFYQSKTNLNYQNYPITPDHNNPNSPAYIHSERDEYKQNILIEEYNQTIKQLRNDLHMQKQVYDVLEKMDRPYLNGQPGNTKNISIGLQDYSRRQSLSLNEKDPEYENNMISTLLSNKDRWTSNDVFYQKYDKLSNEIEHQQTLLNRPVNDHFHPDKGSKYDVETPYGERYPYLADRLGHPEILGTPFERLMRLESDIYHPQNLNQPFIQIPKADPHKDLNFEEGEIIYENTNLQEWAKFLKLAGTGIYAWFVLFVPYQLIMKTHMPLSDAYNNIFLNYYQHSYYNFDSLNLHIPIVAMSLTYSAYYFFKASDRALRDYVVRLQYSKDKELLFVTRISPYGATEEEVYEMAHLEVLPPSVKSALPFLSSQDDDGLWDVTCMNTQNSLVLNNEDKYWAPEQKKQFLNRVTGLWQEYNQPLTQEISNLK